MGHINKNQNVKHQSSCYRNIGGKRYKNYSDLFYSDEENNRIINEAKKNNKNVRVMFRSNEIQNDGSVFKLRAVFVNND